MREEDRFSSQERMGEFIIDYAHTVQAYKNIFREFDMSKKICTLFGCGGDRDKLKRKSTGKDC